MVHEKLLNIPDNKEEYFDNINFFKYYVSLLEEM